MKSKFPACAPIQDSRMQSTRHIVDTTLFFAPRSGGVRSYLLTKHRYLLEQPHVRHTVVIPGPRDAVCSSGIVQLQSPKIPFAGGYRVPLRMAAWRDTLVRLQPDVIEAGDPYHISWAALAAAERIGAPSVAFVHSDLSGLLAKRCGDWVRRHVDAYLRNLYSHFDMVMAPSRVIASRLKAIGIERVVVQPLGVDQDIFHPSRRNPRLREELGLSPRTRLLIFAGRMSREKCVPLLRDAVEGMGAPYHLLLVGGRLSRRVSPRVTMLAFQRDSTRLATLLASADALIHAGASETFGLVVVEAMACGRPVVGVRAGAVPELVTPEVGVLASANSKSSLKEAIHALYESDMNAMSTRARARVEQYYTWRNVLGAQLRRYASLSRSLFPIAGTSINAADTL